MVNRKHFINVVAIWPFLLLVGFVSIYLWKVSVAGYRWTIELVLGLFITIAAFAWLATKDKGSVSFSRMETFCILIPIAALITWSGLSVFWADSWRAAAHHTLLWSLYLLFYILMRGSLSDSQLVDGAINVLGVVIFIIAAAGGMEFLGSIKPITAEFTFRFYSYAEAIICVLPLFVASVLTSKSNRWTLWMLLIAVSWFLVVVTTSRAMFIAGMFGIAAFLILTFRSNSEATLFNRRSIATFIVLVIVALVPQMPLFAGQTSTVTQRLASGDEDSRISARSRLPLWGMAIEGFRLRKLTGIGGDNFYSDYKVLRTKYTERDPNNALLEINEDVIPERTHNEFLQILCELGIVGIVFFAWLIIGIGCAFLVALRRGVSLIALAAFCGMFAFFAASIVSSYSFRFPTNGLCFFFLLAIASREVFARESELKKYHLPVVPLVAIGLIVSLLMIGFSTVRAISILHFSNSQNTQDAATARNEIEEAIAMDPSEPVFRYYNAERLYRASDFQAAVPEFRQAIDHGIATSPAYFDLVASLMKIGSDAETESTFEEAIHLYPRSVFLRTAYASFLKRVGLPERAEAQFRYALGINERQARSWQLAHDEGLEKLVQVARADDRYLSPFDLKPESAPLALANFQRK